MVDKGVASRLQKTIIIYSAVCLFLVSVIIACASIVPFYFQLKGGVEKELLSALSSRGVAVEEYRLRVKDIALQITSRTRIRETLEAYNRGEVSLDELVNFTDSKLLDAMALSSEAAGVSRFDQQGKLVVQVGVPIAEGYLAGSDRTSIGVNIRGLVRQGGKPYVAVITPILNRRSVQVGTDIVLFRASNLRRIVKNYVALGETGETVLGTRRNGQLQSLFSLRGNKSGSSESIPKDSPLELALKRAFEREEGLLQPDEAASNSAVIAYGPIRNSDWVMAVKMDKAELYAPVTRQIALISGLIVGLILLGTFGMVLLVRPLSGKLIIHTDELEEEIEKKTVALQSLLDEHKRAEEELQARYLEIQSLHEISQSILSLPDLKSTLEMILDKALSVVRFDMGNVRLLDADRQMLDLYVSKGYRDPQNAQRHLRKIDETAADGRLLKVLTSKHAWAEEDLSQRPWFRILKREGVQSAVVVPVHAAEEVLGVIQLGSRTQRKFPPNEIRLLEALGNHMGIAIQKARLYEETLSKAKELSGLYSVATVVNQSLDFESILRSVMHKILEIFAFDAARIRLLSDDGKELILLAEEGAEKLTSRSSFPSGLYATILKTGKPYFFEDIQNDPEYHRLSCSKDALKAGFRANFRIPISVKDRIIGVMNFYSKESHRFSPNEVELVKSIANHLGIAIENAQLYEQTKRQAVELAKSIGETEAARRDLEADIVERKWVEEELRSSREQFRDLAAHLQSVREEERTQMARDVHDELGQSLTALKMDLSWLGKKMPKEQGNLQEKISFMSGHVDETVKVVRRIATELRPGVLDDLGIVAAIEWQLHEFQDRSGIACRFSSQREAIALGKGQSTAVFRISQETLTNVARHADASQVEVSLEEVEGDVILRVSDDGKGIEESNMHDPKSLGLLGMRERAFLFGGEVRIDGRPGEGTTVTVRIPLGEQERAKIRRGGKKKETVG